MRQMLWILVGVGLGLSGVSFGRAADQGQAKAVVEKAIQAMGGEARLAKFKAATMKAKGTYYGMGAGIAYTEESAVQLPKQFRIAIDADNFKMTVVVNGNKGWAKTNDNTEELTGDRLAEELESLHAAWVASLIPLRDKEFTLAALGESKGGDRAAVASRCPTRDTGTFASSSTRKPAGCSRWSTGSRIR
jgi:hypothetical protein